MQNSSLIQPIEKCFGLKAEYLTHGQTDPKVAHPLPILLLKPVHHLTKQWVTNIKHKRT